MSALDLLQDWPVDRAAAAVVGPDGVLATAGDVDQPFRLASVTKPLAGVAALIAVTEGAIELAQPAGPEGSTVRHLLAHASGLAFDSPRQVATPGTRRLYSNAGINVLGDLVAEATGIPFPEYLRQGLTDPLGMTATTVDGPPAHAGVSTVADLARFAGELLAPRLLHPETLRDATDVQFPGLIGVLPGFGRQDPNDWGLSFEIRGSKSPHWTGSANSPATFGHFGQSGTFLWVDPRARLACVALADRDFDDWARKAWPTFSDAVLEEFG